MSYQCRNYNLIDIQSSEIQLFSNIHRFFTFSKIFQLQIFQIFTMIMFLKLPKPCSLSKMVKCFLVKKFHAFPCCEGKQTYALSCSEGRHGFSFPRCEGEHGFSFPRSEGRHGFAFPINEKIDKLVVLRRKAWIFFCLWTYKFIKEA